MTVQPQAVQDRPSTDRIEKRVVVRASRSRVWHAISTAKQFSSWFRIHIDGEFAEGVTVRGRVAVPGLEHLKMEILIERLEPERYLAYRWHPYPSDPAEDYSAEPTTLVEFTLEDADGGTAVTIVESGFDRIPLARRAEAFRVHDQGWSEESENLMRHVS
jgi:uncharacterized protein YndB with AHSA1/START domain